jgi:hypothetical protein
VRCPLDRLLAVGGDVLRSSSAGGTLDRALPDADVVAETFPDLMVHMVEGVQPAQRGADPIRTHRRQGRGVATKSAGSAGGGEHDAGAFQLGLNP